MENSKSERRIDLIDKPLLGAIIVSYICFCICTFLRKPMLIALFSPITVVLTGTMILVCLTRLGKFWVPSLILALGILFYGLADVIFFFDDYVIGKSTMGELIATLYLLPNYFFGTSVAVYFLQKLKKKDLYQFLVNVFVMTVIGFVIFRRFLISLGSYEILSTPQLLRVYLYFSINFFILIMIGHMTYMIASETGLKQTNTMILGILVYILFDIPYTYFQAIGRDPENDYTNLCYTLCMMLMAYGIYHQVHHRYVFKLKTYEYTEKSARRTKILTLLGILISVILWATKVIEQNELFYLILPLLVYWLTTAVLQSSALNEQLLKQRDILTGLYNRRYSSNVMEDSVKRAQENHNRFAVYCVDLNNFKPINDTYGHDMGDRVLKEFGSRMLELPSDYVSFRTGGDEFMIVYNGIEKDEDVVKTAVVLQELFHRPISLDTYVFAISGSIGAAVYPDDSKEIETLIRYADAAMYSVKHSSNKDNFKLFDVSLVETVREHKALEVKLRDADPARDFVLHYQPRVDAESGRLVAAEVFPRLKDDDSLTAAEILPIAEEVGLMNRLGKWIVETALHQQKVWRDDDGVDISISINLAPLQLLDNDFLAELKNLTNSNNLNPSRIFLDISNDAIMGASITAKDTLRELSRYGFRLSLNDFGGGDINLFHILNCGFSSIHLSPSLIKRGDTQEEANTLIKTIIGLAESMGITANAVGIETKGQADKLSHMGATCLQGYYFGKPVSAEEFSKAKYFTAF